MDLAESVAALIHHNRWRRGDDRLEMIEPSQIGLAIDRVCGAAPQLLAALQGIHAMCVAMDAEWESERPSEEDYQAAMQAAERQIAAATERGA